MILLRNLFGIVALLVALLAAVPAGAGEPGRVQDGGTVQATERGLPPPASDFITRRLHRHAGSLEEFFSIDDDSDQYVQLPPLPVKDVTWYTLIEEPQPAIYHAVSRSHWPRAAPSTGPPHV